MTMNHHRVGQLLSAYLDGELPAPDAAAVQEHLMDCGACRDAYEDLRGTKGLLGQLPLAEPPAGFWAVVREPGARRESSHARWTLPRLRRPAWGLVAALIILILVAFPLVKGTVDRLHATEIGVDLYIREHARQMSMEPLTDRAYLGLVEGDADVMLVGENLQAGEGAR